MEQKKESECQEKKEEDQRYFLGSSYHKRFKYVYESFSIIDTMCDIYTYSSIDEKEFVGHKRPKEKDEITTYNSNILMYQVFTQRRTRDLKIGGTPLRVAQG